MSSTGRKRMFFATSKSVAVLVIACASLWAGYEVYRTWENDPAKIKAPVKNAIVKNISLRGQNLVLDQPWVVKTLALPPNADLVAIDLYSLQARLMASGQIKSAELTRKFPDTLVVSIEERSPVARVNVRFGEGEAETYLVARDGVVYQGSGYKDEVMKSLPFLAGISLRRTNGKLQPIEGMNVVADLLGTARVHAPKLYRNWAILSLEKLKSDGQLIVQSTDAGSAIFGTREDFFKQIARLDFIIDESHKNPAAAPLKTVNLAVGEQVPVSFELPAADAPAQGEATTAAPATRSSRTPASRTVAPTPTTRHAPVPAPRLRTAPTRPLQANSATKHHIRRRDF
ncbi:MAG TPA: FtsQ-type POTRA domain-containing protein [Opitutaceae bacterium]|nr:FtsQ-type POTRA domain-containing protein [Opitutaceae bacterium]